MNRYPVLLTILGVIEGGLGQEPSSGLRNEQVYSPLALWEDDNWKHSWSCGGPSAEQFWVYQGGLLEWPWGGLEGGRGQA